MKLNIQFRKEWIKPVILAVLLLLLVILAGSCACGKKKDKKPDAAAQEVLKISITPSPMPTEAPEQVSKKAVSTNGNVTMVNEYLAQKEKKGANDE